MLIICYANLKLICTCLFNTVACRFVLNTIRFLFILSGVVMATIITRGNKTKPFCTLRFFALRNVFIPKIQYLFII